MFAVRRPASLLSACADTAAIRGRAGRKAFFFFNFISPLEASLFVFFPGSSAKMIILTVFDF